MTNQEIFNKVYIHLINQGRPAMNDGLCRYRAEDGCSCAVGVLIPDDAYDPRIEGCSVKNLEAIVLDGASGRRRTLVKVLEQSNLAALEHRPLLKSLQAIHDGCPTVNGVFSMDQLKAQLKGAAEKFNLEVPTC